VVGWRHDARGPPRQRVRWGDTRSRGKPPVFAISQKSLQPGLGTAPMNATLMGFNVILAAKVLNPSIIRESWLLREGLLQEEDLQPGFVFSEQAVSVPTKSYLLTVVPNQLAFAPADRDIGRRVVGAVLVPFVEKLRHTPFTAVGLNYVWHIDPEPETVSVVTQRLFLPPAFPLASEFPLPDAHFGIYMSKTVLEFRLRLDMKPLLRALDGRHVVQLAFNFHRELSGEDTSRGVIEALRRWNECDSLAERMTRTLMGGAQ